MELTERKSHFTELNYMNAIGCLLVILIHVLSVGIVRVAPATWQGAFIFFPWQLAGFVVPMFLFTGGVKMSLQFGKRPISLGAYWRYIGQRFLKIYLPYVMWTLIYYAVFFQLHIIQYTPQQLFHHLLAGTISAQFYYIILLMQFYILLPVWMKLIQGLSLYIAICGGLMLNILALQLPALLHVLDIEFLYTDRIFVSYIVFWLLGLYVGLHSDAVYQFIKKKRGHPLLSFALIFGFVCIAYGRFATDIYIFDLTLVKIVSDILSIFLLFYICTLVKKSAFLQRILTFVHQSSLFVYLSHCLFLVVAEYFLSSAAIFNLGAVLPIRAVVCYTIPFALYWGYQGAARFIKGSGA